MESLYQLQQLDKDFVDEYLWLFMFMGGVMTEGEML